MEERRFLGEGEDVEEGFVGEGEEELGVGGFEEELDWVGVGVERSKFFLEFWLGFRRL